MIEIIQSSISALGLNGSNVVTEALVTCLLVWALIAPLPMRIQRIRRQILSLTVGIILLHLLLSPCYAVVANFISRWASISTHAIHQSMTNKSDVLANTALVTILLFAVATQHFQCSAIPAKDLLQTIGGRLGIATAAEAATDPRAHIKAYVPESKMVGAMTKTEIKRVFKEILEENDSPFDEDHLPKYGQTYFAKVNESQQLDLNSLREDLDCLQEQQFEYFDMAKKQADEINDTLGELLFYAHKTEVEDRDDEDDEEPLPLPSRTRKASIRPAQEEEGNTNTLTRSPERWNRPPRRTADESAVGAANQQNWRERPQTTAFPILLAEEKPARPADKHIPRTIIPKDLLIEIHNLMTVEEITAKLEEYKRELKRRYEQGQRLTPLEQTLKTLELEKRWDEEKYQRRYGNRQDRPLTEEEKRMTRGQIRRILTQERREAWAQRQRDMGIKLVECPKCGGYEKPGDRHRCIRAPYKGPMERRRGVPVQQQMVVEATPTGVNIKHQPVVDLNKLLKEQEALNKAIEQVTKRARPWDNTPQPGEKTDVPMVMATEEPEEIHRTEPESSTDAAKRLRVGVHRTTNPF